MCGKLSSGVRFAIPEQEKTMTKMKVLAATAAILGMAGSASAADVYEQGGSLKDAPFVEPAPTWNGVYMGVGGGVSATTYDSDHDGAIFDGTVVGLPIFPLFEEDRSDIGDLSGFGTVQLGFDRQRGNWVFGLFADYDWMNMDTEIDGNTIDLSVGGVPGVGLLDASLSTEIDNMWSVGGRIGFLSSPDTLLYGLLAYTQADVTAIGNLTLFNGAGGTVSSLTNETDLDADGVTVGAGIETKLAEQVSLKFEYRYTDLDDGNLTGDGFVVPGVLGVTGSDLDLEADIHSVRAVLVYRPDWSGRHDLGF
jgi:outer membrane immunogenic protein